MRGQMSMSRYVLGWDFEVDKMPERVDGQTLTFPRTLLITSQLEPVEDLVSIGLIQRALQMSFYKAI